MMQKVQINDIGDEALTWLGTPYHHRGRVKGVGVDCGSFRSTAISTRLAHASAWPTIFRAHSEIEF